MWFFFELLILLIDFRQFYTKRSLLIIDSSSAEKWKKFCYA